MHFWHNLPCTAPQKYESFSYSLKILTFFQLIGAFKPQKEQNVGIWQDLLGCVWNSTLLGLNWSIFWPTMEKVTNTKTKPFNLMLIYSVKHPTKTTKNLTFHIKFSSVLRKFFDQTFDAIFNCNAGRDWDKKNNSTFK